MQGYPAMGLLAVGAAAALTVFPLPLDSTGAVFPAAMACYHRTAAVLLFMLTFLFGSLLRAAAATAVRSPLCRRLSLESRSRGEPASQV